MFILAFMLTVLFMSDKMAAKMHEPSCSYVDNLEKIIEKVVRNEHKLGLFGDKLDEMEFRLNKKLLELDSSEAERNRNVDTAITNMKEMQQSLNEKSLNMQQDLQETKNGVDESKEVLKQTLAEELKKHDVALKSLKDTYNTPTVLFTATQATGTDVIEGKAIVFTKTVSNEGDAYNNTTGHFTAPYNGVYFFHTTVCSTKGLWLYVHLMAAGTAVSSTFKFNVKADGTCTSIGGVAKLSIGDIAWVKVAFTNPNAIFAGNARVWPAFSGMLIHT